MLYLYNQLGQILKNNEEYFRLSPNIKIYKNHQKYMYAPTKGPTTTPATINGALIVTPSTPAPVAPADCNKAKVEPLAIIPPSPACIVAANEPAATPEVVKPAALIAEALIALTKIGVAPAATPAIVAIAASSSTLTILVFKFQGSSFVNRLRLYFYPVYAVSELVNRRSPTTNNKLLVIYKQYLGEAGIQFILSINSLLSNTPEITIIHNVLVVIDFNNKKTAISCSPTPEAQAQTKNLCR